jgi:hypothetical protein
MNMPKIEITENQKKIIIISSIVFFIFLFFWVFLYLPAAKEIGSLKKELVLTSNQIQAIELLLSGSGSRDQAIRLLKQKQQYLNSKFPQKEEESLRFVSDLARKNKIYIISLQPGSKTELLDENGKSLTIQGKVANFLPITMEVSCFYKDLVKYLLELKNNSPAFISVISLNVKNDIQQNGKVRASITFNLYLLI